jgi:hypothetical protein
VSLKSLIIAQLRQWLERHLNTISQLRVELSASLDACELFVCGIPEHLSRVKFVGLDAKSGAYGMFTERQQGHKAEEKQEKVCHHRQDVVQGGKESKYKNQEYIPVLNCQAPRCREVFCSCGMGPCHPCQAAETQLNRGEFSRNHHSPLFPLHSRLPPCD